MHTGFYVNNEQLDFSVLEYKYQKEFSTATGDAFDFSFSACDMLHGFCDIFAEALHKECGAEYKIYSLLDSEDRRLTHCYCMTFQNGKRYYADIRGITDSWEEFLSEFADFVDTEDEQELLNEGLIVPYNINMINQDRDYLNGTDFEKKMMEISLQIVHQNTCYHFDSVA